MARVLWRGRSDLGVPRTPQDKQTEAFRVRCTPDNGRGTPHRNRGCHGLLVAE